MAESEKQRLEAHLAQLKNERSSYESHWRDLSDFINPRGSRFLASETNKGDRRNTKIVDPEGSLAHRTLSSGMMSGITSPARPWFKLETPDPEMMNNGQVKIWCETVQKRMNEVFNRSNLYQSLPIIYGQLGTFATGSLSVVDDETDVIRTYPRPIGSFYLANNARLSIDTDYREFSMTVRQLVMKFGLKSVSGTVKSLWDAGRYETWVQVVHAVFPNVNRDTGRMDSKNKLYKSVYYEKTGDGDTLLSEMGFDEFPNLSPRWEINGEDVYGSNCPGMLALGQIKALQLEQKRKSQLIDKATNPPMIGPSALKKERVSMIPGAITYIDQVTGTEGLRPAYLVNPNTADLMADIQDTRQIIDRSYFVDLFMMLQNVNTRSMPVEAVVEMREEKLLMLGPVLERLNDELLNPLIERTYAIMARRKLLPEPPKVLHGIPLKITYISVMAQAQKAIGLSSLERFVGFVGNLAQDRPDALDKLNVDQAIDNYAEMSGVSPLIVVPQEQVEQIREQRAQQAQQQQAMEMGVAAAQGAKTLSETQTSEPSALTALAEGAGGQQ